MMLIEGIFLKHSPDFEQPSRTLDNNSIDIYQHVTVYVNRLDGCEYYAKVSIRELSVVGSISPLSTRLPCGAYG
ncbi:MAG: hypothetical protein DRR08_05150 [Candidatus Parabeggiatoa sp. nov. 2]|nr:MAG: hypothetical protein B6247_18445 [Beggiatoa sp. 4572_84]RKZ62755.1 MAG: hypothetical protein DRR08_05150 [Gammaproteobacteria bacterium]